jgi:UDP-N-acetylglucosamine--N-acetylmuramyl-(pentapeptide) pyrophosphoryl-undecaprenol N-acetylglucosamine transferase
MATTNKSKKIFLSGGGTGGSVTPILEISKELIAQDADLEFVFIGTSNGPEEMMVRDFKDRDLHFTTLPAGKLRRYFSLNNFFDLFKIVAAFFKALKLIKKEQPDLIISAGSFASVPLVYAAALKKIPILIHQQDIRPGLANKLMAPVARVVTVAFEQSLVDYGPKAVLVGNPISIPENLLWPAEISESFMATDKPLIFVTGGGTGATALNELIFKAKAELLKHYRVIHLTGKGKLPVVAENNLMAVNNADYFVSEFLNHDGVLAVMKRADLIISRCGLGALTELAVLGKLSILIPLPQSQQEDNAAVFARAEAALVLRQEDITPDSLVAAISSLLNNREMAENLRHHIIKIMKKNAAELIASIVLEIIK